MDEQTVRVSSNRTVQVVVPEALYYDLRLIALKRRSSLSSLLVSPLSLFRDENIGIVTDKDRKYYDEYCKNK